MKTLTITRERGQSGDRRRQIIGIAVKKARDIGGGDKIKKKKKRRSKRWA